MQTLFSLILHLLRLFWSNAMIRKFVLILFLCLLPYIAHGATGDLETFIGKTDTALTTVIGKTGSGVATVLGKNYTDGDGGATTKWVGFPNTAGTPSAPVGAFADYGTLGADRVYGRSWTATENGTIQSVNIRPGSLVVWDADGTQAWITVYNGTTLVGFCDVGTGWVANTWEGQKTVTVAAGQSLDFSTNDVLHFGVTWPSSNGATDGNLSNDNGASDGVITYSSDTEVGTVDPPTTVGTWSNSASHGLAAIMQYVTR